MMVLRHITALIGLATLACFLTNAIAAQEAVYGTIPSRFHVTQLGEASYSLAVELPEGPGGIRPTISLEYRHRAGDGPLGMGWGIGGLSSITRCPQTVAQDGQAREVRYDSGDKYCLGGQRLIVINGGTYGAANSEYRTEVESFKKVVAIAQRGNGPEYFIVTDQRGTQYHYGDGYGSSIVDAATGSNRQWALHYIRDTSNNDIEIFWTTGAPGELLLDKIDYTRNSPQGMTSAYRVDFVYEDKPAAHQRAGSHWGAPVASTKRLKTIDIAHLSGSWQSVRRYELRYVPVADAPHHSLLESVQQCGTTECFNGHWFEWADGQINTSGFGAAATSSANSSTGSVYIGDFNGDGKQDVASPFYVNNGAQWSDYRLAIYYSNGTGFNSADVQQLAHCSEYRVIELNGDGRSDLMCLDGWNGTGVPADVYFFESTASGWVTRLHWPTTVQWEPNAYRYRALTGDINGDGLTDLITSEAGGWWIRLGTGGDFTAPTSVGVDAQSQPISLWLGTLMNMDDDQALEVVVPWVESGSRYQGVAVFQYDPNTAELQRYITQTGMNVPAKPFGLPEDLKPLPDINGDGLADLAYGGDASHPFKIRLNLGNAFGPEYSSNLLGSQMNVARYADVNNDGRDDLVVPYDEPAGTWVAYYSSGTTFGAGSSVEPFADASALYFLDVTGDGAADAVYKDGTDTWHVHPHLVEPESVSTFWDGRGNWQKVTYLPLTQKGYYAYGTPSLPTTRMYYGPMSVVDTVEANSGIGMESYSYATGVVGDTYLTQYWYWDPMVDNRGRGFLGFGYFRTRDYRQGYQIDRALHQTFPLTGWPLATLRARPNGTHIELYEAATPVVTAMGPGRYYVHIDQETFREYELNQQLTRTINRTRTYSTTSGAVDLETVTTTAPTGETYTTSTDFTLLDLGVCLGLPDQVSVTRSGYQMTAQTRTIDNNFDSTCRLQSTVNTSEPLPSKQLKESYTYDGFGNVKTITLDSADGTAADRQTEFFYDTLGHPGHLPSSISRYVSGEPPHTESFTWDYKLILPLARTAVGGLTTTWIYDDLGRLYRETRADGSSTDILRTIYVNDLENSVPAQGFYGSDGSIAWEYLDSYGRTVGTQTVLAENWNRVAGQRFFYDEIGFLDKETQPFIWGDSEYQIDYTRDILGRVIQESRPISEAQPSGAITTVNYAGLTTTVTAPGNPGNQTTITLRDAIGRIVRVTDSLNGQINYKYNAFDQLMETKDPANHTTTISYNNRGDKTSLIDPDMGTWTYPEYTVYGELSKQVDAKGQTVLFGYDQLGRLDWRTEPEFPNGPGPEDDGKTDFTYYATGDSRHGLPKDEIFPGTNTFRRTYDYDAWGRLGSETTTIDGTARLTEYAYHSSGPGQGKLRYITYPTSTSSVKVKLEHEYDSVGALWKIKDVTTGTTFNGGVIYQLNATDALRRETSATLGNGFIPATRVYDRANLLLESIQTGTGNAIQNLQYDWHPNGNLEEINDLRIGRIDNFTYDTLGRLDTQTLNGGQILNLDYAAGGDGNLQFKTGVGTYASYGVGSGGPHAVTSITGLQSNAYTYDANGNMTNRDGDAITWFSHNRPKKINYGSSSSEFWYGTDRSRYKHVAISGGTTTTTRYFGPHFEVETRGSLTIYRHYIFAGGQAVAQYERRSSGSPANDIQYLHRDHLASVVATTNGAGTVRQRWEYDAFGFRSRSVGSGADDSERGYTGHEHLDAVELTHMNGRVQDPELGRFISADPFVQAPYHSQSLNRYSYVWNNPLTLVDPSGFQGRITDWNREREGSSTYDPYRDKELACLLDHELCKGVPAEQGACCVLVDVVGVPHTAFVFGRVDDSPQGGFSPTSWRTDFFVFNPVGRAIAWPGNFVAPFWQYDGQQVNPISGEVLSIQTQQDVAVLSTALGAAGALRGLGVRSAEAAADAAFAAGKRAGGAAELRVGNRVFTGVSGEVVPHNPQVTGALMGTRSVARAPWHGACAEIVCLDKAFNAGVNPAGGTMRSVNIGVSGTGHNTSKVICSSCRDILEFFGVSY